MKQTAVEWLYERLERMIPRTISYNIDKRQYLQQAKEMEKEQIMNSFADGFVEGVETQKSGEQLLFPEQYYNETYGEK